MNVLKIDTFDNDWFVIHGNHIENFMKAYNSNSDVVKIGKSYVKKSNIRLMEETKGNAFDLLYLACDDTRAMKRAYEKEKSVGVLSHEEVIRRLGKTFGEIPYDMRFLDFITGIVEKKYMSLTVF